jgi:hypothetical protein
VYISVSSVLFLVAGITFAGNSVDSNAQSQPALIKYENPAIGIRFEYPDYMLPPVESCESKLQTGVCILTLVPKNKLFGGGFIDVGVDDPNYPRNFNTKSPGPCPCSNLMNYVRWDYGKGDEEEIFLNDNQTLINKNHTAWQMETTEDTEEKSWQKLRVWAVNENVGYNFYYIASKDAFGSNLPVFRQLLDSVTFMPPTPEKRPSFLNSSDISNLQESPTQQAGPVRILSSNQFIDRIGYSHVVGEVENNTPASIEFVKVTGTFYDSNNQVVATDFTYTNPSDIALGQKAPFELILTSASIPVAQIDHYNLQVSYK